MLKTRITELLGIEYPIIQGAMLWLSSAELASAVSNAGGLGILSSANFTTAEELRQGIRKTKSMTDKPFAVNITLLPTFRPVSHEEYIRTAIEEGVSIIETSGRNPEAHMKMLKDAKSITWGDITPSIPKTIPRFFTSLNMTKPIISIISEVSISDFTQDRG